MSGPDPTSPLAAGPLPHPARRSSPTRTGTSPRSSSTARSGRGRSPRCVVGTIDYRIGRPGQSARHGRATSSASPPTRTRGAAGYARACMEALLDWFRERGVRQVDLRASADAEPLYASLGFVRTPDPAMRLTLLSR